MVQLLIKCFRNTHVHNFIEHYYVYMWVHNYIICEGTLQLCVYLYVCMYVWSSSMELYWWELPIPT